MTEFHHQTLKLGRGAHASPAEGACVMELASLLAGEPFSDNPDCASPVIAAFLRTYNDLLDDRRRQDLRRLASEVVGSRGDAATETARALRCIEWGDERANMSRLSPLTRLLARHGRRLDLAGSYAASGAWSLRRTDDEHEEALRFVAELLGVPSVEILPATAEAGVKA